MINIPKVLIKLQNILEISEECRKHVLNKEFTKIKKDYNNMEASGKDAVDELTKIEEEISEENKRSRILKIKEQVDRVLKQDIAAVKRKHDILIIDPHREFTKQGLIEDLDRIQRASTLLISELARISQSRILAA